MIIFHCCNETIIKIVFFSESTAELIEYWKNNKCRYRTQTTNKRFQDSASSDQNLGSSEPVCQIIMLDMNPIKSNWVPITFSVFGAFFKIDDKSSSIVWLVELYVYKLKLLSAVFCNFVFCTPVTGRLMIGSWFMVQWKAGERVFLFLRVNIFFGIEEVWLMGDWSEEWEEV